MGPAVVSFAKKALASLVKKAVGRGVQKGGEFLSNPGDDQDNQQGFNYVVGFFLGLAVNNPLLLAAIFTVGILLILPFFLFGLDGSTLVTPQLQ